MSRNLHKTRVCKYRQQYVWFKIWLANLSYRRLFQAVSESDPLWHQLQNQQSAFACFVLQQAASIWMGKTTLARILLQKLRAPSSTPSKQKGRKYISKSRYKIRFIPSSRGDSMDREAPNCNTSIQIYFDVHGESFPLTIPDTFCYSIQFSTFAAECFFLNATMTIWHLFSNVSSLPNLLLDTELQFFCCNFCAWAVHQSRRDSRLSVEKASYFAAHLQICWNCWIFIGVSADGSRC